MIIIFFKLISSDISCLTFPRNPIERGQNVIWQSGRNKEESLLSRIIHKLLE